MFKIKRKYSEDNTVYTVLSVVRGGLPSGNHGHGMTYQKDEFLIFNHEYNKFEWVSQCNYILANEE